ncbi:MAG TPA: DUF3501 family protein [Acidimicrobiales bacterium]|nr:DUF3501 family protein [Acidimicrobiales bacterium]
MSTATSPRKLTLADIVDLRAYEREREEFRAHIISLKKRRRVSIGPVLTLLFENRDTIRFQIQEMARVEKLITDEAIEGELRAYNPLIPEPGQVSATLFLELTDEMAMREWLPKLVGIERSVVLRAGSGADVAEVRCIPEEGHEAQLTRAETTASVHYVRWELTPSEVEAVAAGPVSLVVDHDHYPFEVALADDTVAELLTDLRA